MTSFGARAATLVAFGLSCVFAGCGVLDDEGLDSTEHVSTPILGGSTATEFPESALLEMSQQGVIKAACSGAVIAPRVVLTAGHCVAGFTGWNVRAPFLNQAATSSSAEVFDWKSGGELVDPNLHDLGLVYLDRAITVPRYPVLVQGPVANGSSIVNIGRIDNGTLSNAALFVSKPLTVQAGASFGYPFDYVTADVIESGDSGGPVEVPGTKPHALVAVNSGAGGGTQVLARVDLLASWIADRIATHGGAGIASPPVAVTPPAPGCSGPAEAEPNDDYRSSHALGSSVCGTLGSNDNQDWYAWSIDGAEPYSLKLAASGDASIAMWKLVDGMYAQVANTSAQEVSHTASAAGSYVLVVYTPSGAAQPYTLTLTK